MTPEESKFDFSGNDKSLGSGKPRSWWGKKEQGDLPSGPAMVDCAKAIEASPAEGLRQDLNLLHGSMFEGKQLTSMYQYGGAAATAGIDGGIVGEITWNVTRSVMLTVASQVARSRPRARCLTTRGKPTQRRKAQKLTQLLDGLFESCDVYATTQRSFVHAGSFDVVGIEIYRDGDVPKIALIRACELMIDANDGVDRAPRSLYRRKFVDKSVLLAKFGKVNKDGTAANEKTQAIMDAQVETPRRDGATSNLVEVYEAWHLPSKKGAGDGRHVMAFTGTLGTLVDEEYERDSFPILLFTIDEALEGPYGQSPAAVLLPIQLAINSLLAKIARAQHMVSRPAVWLPIASKVANISNEIAGKNYYAGNQPPTFYSPIALQREVYDQLERHYEKAFSLYGVSAQVAAGQKEAGLTAAVAIRESLDIQTARFALLSQRWEKLHMDIAKRLIAVCKEIYQDNKELRIAAPGTAFLDTIDWSEVDMDEDEFTISLAPASLLPNTPQGRLDRVVELVDKQIWSSQRGEDALDDLDPDAHMRLDRAGRQRIEKLLAAMIEDAKYEGPDVTMNLTECLKAGAEYLNSEEVDGAPEKNIDLLYRWLDDTAALQALVTPAPAPAAPPMNVAPPAPPQLAAAA